MLDRSEPNLLRREFPYSRIPPIRFEADVVAQALPAHIWITDTTFRDGQQARAPYSVEQIVRLYDLLNELGGPVIRQTEFFAYTPIDREAIAACQQRPGPEVTTWMRASLDDLKAVQTTGVKETGILVSASDYHIYLKMNRTRREALDDYGKVVRAVIHAGLRPRCHLEDLTRADLDGFVAPLVESLQQIGREAQIPVKFRLCDTMGFGLPWPDAALPRGVPRLVQYFTRTLGVAPELLEWHGHNDFHRGEVNTVAAWLYGCAAANGSLFGFGERTGNPPLEALVIDYIGLRGETPGVDTTAITRAAAYFRDQLGTPLPANYPFAGAGFNVTSAGIHADGLLKNEEIYNIFDTARILDRPLGITVNDRSGLAGVAYWVNTTLGLKGAAQVRKDDPRVAAIHREVERQYAAGRTTGFSPDEMLTLAKLHFGNALATSARS
ncbi:MAG: citrate (Re)-synthase [Chloroflexota bacterium]|jgi:isopropylmalate/homocitrate/citramalate synthase|nr:citrate (Re)-synthase [Chloroflexota bacterium]